MQRSILAALFAVNAGCGLISIQGPSDPSKDAEPQAASESKPSAGSNHADASPTPVAEEVPGDQDAQRNLLGWHSQAEELERLSQLSVSFAVQGISAADLDAQIQRFFKAGESPSKKTLEQRDELADRFAKALTKAAAKGEAPKRGAADPKAEKAMRAHFEQEYASATIKAVYLTDSTWKQNYTDELKIKVRNRYKEGVVIISIKDQPSCVAVPANVAQASTGNGGFAPEYKHDSFTAGRVVACP